MKKKKNHSHPRTKARQPVNPRVENSEDTDSLTESQCLAAESSPFSCGRDGGDTIVISGGRSPP